MPTPRHGERRNSRSRSRPAENIVSRAAYELLEVKLRGAEVFGQKLQEKTQQLKKELNDARSQLRASELHIESLSEVIRLKDQQIHQLIVEAQRRD